MENAEFAKHLFSFTGVLNYLLAAVVQAEKTASLQRVIFLHSSYKLVFLFHHVIKKQKESISLL